jgi:type I restriction enzyme S subunit
MSSLLQVEPLIARGRPVAVLPPLWRVVPLSEIATFKNGYAYKSSDWTSSGVPVIKIANVGSGEVTLDGCSFISEKLAIETKDFSVNNGDFLIALSGVTLGNSGTFRHSEKARLNQRVARMALKPSSEFSPRLLELYFESPVAFQNIWRAAKGAAQPNISTKSIEGFVVPIPPMDEQVKIVEILDEQMSRLDAALVSVRTAREKAERFRRSLLHAAFTGALTGHDVQTGKPPIGWKECNLGALVDLKSGFAYKSLDWVSDGVAVIKIANVRNGKVDLSGCSYITQEIAKETSNFCVSFGDLLMTLTGEIGATGVYKETVSARLNQRVARIDIRRPDEILFDFLYLLLESPDARQNLWSKAQGVAQPNISPREVLALPIQVPPVVEQEVIMKLLAEQLSRLDASLSVADEIEKKSSALRRSLLHAAFNGELTKEWREGKHV